MIRCSMGNSYNSCRSSSDTTHNTDSSSLQLQHTQSSSFESISAPLGAIPVSPDTEAYNYIVPSSSATLASMPTGVAAAFPHQQSSSSYATGTAGRDFKNYMFVIFVIVILSYFIRTNSQLLPAAYFESVTNK